MMNDVEQRLDQLTPRGVRPELREHVLGAVTRELQHADSVPLLGTSSAVSMVGVQHCLCQAVAHVDTKCGPSAEPNSPWLRRATLAVAASLLLGIGLNFWATKTSERRLAQLFGPPPISKQAMEIAKDVERITNAATGQWVYGRLTMPRQSADSSAANKKYRDAIKRLIDELQTVSKDSYRETPQKDPEMDRGHTGRLGRDRFDCQRLVGLDYRFTA